MTVRELNEWLKGVDLDMEVVMADGNPLTTMDEVDDGDETLLVLGDVPPEEEK